ncbi:MAG: transglutaminase family protein [Myxococcales bacterium]|nr:transglutaminase family protein [Myxococcales bacterium]
MAIYAKLDHSMRYDFDRPVRASPHVLRLFPAPHTRTPVHDHQVDIQPSEHHLYPQQDPFGNVVARVVMPEPVTHLHVNISLTADITVINPFDFFVEGYAEHYPFRYDALLATELEAYLQITERGPRLLAWLSKLDLGRRHIVDFLVGLNAQLQQHIDYTIRMEPGIQTCEQTLARRLGSCRDTGWLLVQVLRHLGLAARFVSGYLVQLKPDEKSLDGPSGTDRDFTDLHAWAEVYVPGAGWIGLDPTSGLFAGEGHIPLACTPDPASAAPLAGATDKCEVRFSHSNVVTRVHEDPRVTKPYTDAQWEAIRTLGKAVDTELEALDVRLTMGGEPTFVSIDDMEGDEWNTAALGVAKRERAGALLARLQAAFGPGGLLHCGMGKWYPGEPLPRWALGCYWRRDGALLWSDRRWLADERKDYGFGAEDGERFGARLAARLGLEASWLVEGREDWAHYLWREATQPNNVDHTAVSWAPQFRDDLSLALARGLGQPVGHALPIAWSPDLGWFSGQWSFPRGAMYLTPGSSPMGLRLPLDQLPWAAYGKLRGTEVPPDSGSQAPRKPQPLAPRFPAQRAGDAPAEPVAAGTIGKQTAEPLAPRPNTPDGLWGMWTVPHTALCVEARGGRLYLFMPKLRELSAYQELIAAIEATAAELRMPLLLEGYDPPADPELSSLKVTPDPGVIEVNIHPATCWQELEDNTVTLYEQARLARLGTEKFMLDGRHTGTGGGNHVTLGGPTPADSPFLRRPDLLRSFITYWQHHPALSYLFCGLFVGPTSQAPRVDERGSQHLLELERGFQELEQGIHPAQIDAVLRSFLTDITGNTHRAEFCIDKLCSPDSAAGGQGLVEFRGFEMPPHARMSLAQMLLMRALLARFWRDPYRHPLVSWGTQLHDRFMLPEAIWADFRDVIDDLNHAGYPFDLGWFDPFLEFRFPLYGRATYDGVELELRMALEPWLVLGDEAAAQRQAREVDSSVERLQIKCQGLDPQRHLVTCNGRRLPLQKTGREREYFAGVRYKAFKPTFCLHPTIEADAPLVIDLFDRQLGRAIGGCVYHVDHPGGRNYEAYPVNPYEAEARRIGRFWAWGHTAGECPAPAWTARLNEYDTTRETEDIRQPPAERPNPEYPFTLDLRRLPPGLHSA